ncbi:MAG: inositol monophosphatase [Azospirillaceae bacterium]
MHYPEIDRVAALVAEVAAEEMVPRFRALEHGDVREKGPGDVVTIVDEICEARLTEGLSDMLPGSVVVGEEAAAADERVIDRLDGEDPVWIIDPLDGTRNFADGKEAFVSMVALAHGGELVGAWIHDPIKGETAVAERGAGAFMAGRRLAVAEARPIDAMAGAFGKPARGPRREAADRLGKAMRHDERITSAGLTYIELAAGRLDVGLFSRLWPWDHAPGVLLHREAGGHDGLTPSGTRYSPRHREGALLCAADAETWGRVRDLIADLAL